MPLTRSEIVLIIIFQQQQHEIALAGDDHLVVLRAGTVVRCTNASKRDFRFIQGAMMLL